MKRKSMKIIFGGLSLCLLILVQSAVADNSLKINYVSGLNFGASVNGDPPKTILPGTTETSTNASFSLRGKKNNTYQVIVPSEFYLNHSVLGASAQIRVDNFTYYPSSPQLDRRGNGNLYVGATRAALPLSQVPGSYSGTFVITVIY